ncbi:hypothetical protein EGI31_15075 [Lacihabitans soyangensis]|uniref:Uncharacterized protein n=1 Tax=Lacihabitans soyangensis TaxID=869394 RepID=A0AAE3H5A7_9BACT|nr:hypothetical protein [Lacihabitans soyangensis]
MHICEENKNKFCQFTRYGNKALGGNSTYKKLAVQWLNEALCFASSSVVADSFRLRNRQLLVAAKRWPQLTKPLPK